MVTQGTESSHPVIPSLILWENYLFVTNDLLSVSSYKGYVKSLVYADKPQTLDYLEDNIHRVIADIRSQMLEKVIENWTSRLDYIRASRGSPIPEIIFKIDESQFCISGNQSRAYVRRRTHEDFRPQCLTPTVKYPTKVMVWGCMSSHGVGRLHIVSGTVKAMGYIEILQNKLLPTARELLGNQSWIFQDDNALAIVQR
ncbi:transposable element Tcb1 transposase [Trichonephila clavipes]|nr:transposable element Tcb1 transposase [Trichonephila clavipes]